MESPDEPPPGASAGALGTPAPAGVGVSGTAGAEAVFD